MRDIATTVLTAAAVACGLPEGSVYPELVDEAKEKVFLPEQRLEMAFLDETYAKQGWRVGKAVAANPNTSRTRWTIYKVTLPVRVLVRWDDQKALDAFCRAFLLALPGKVTDADGNRVRITAQRATRKGYTFASIKIEETPTQALHISFTGILHRDVDMDYVTTITIHPEYEVPQ